MVKSKKTNKPEETLAQFFLKSVGVNCGLYNPATKELVEDLESQPLYQGNVNAFAFAMTIGWTYDDLHHLVGSNYKNGVRAALVSDIIPKREEPLKETDNLLEEDVEYYHSALFDTTAPRFAVAGSMMIPVSKGSVTRKETFTLRDLMQYFYENIKTAMVSRRREAETKTMIWLLKQMPLDEILFAIDEASIEDVEVPVIELTQYAEQGRQELNYRRARSQ